MNFPKKPRVLVYFTVLLSSAITTIAATITAQAQAWQCRVPANLPRPHAEQSIPSQIRRTPVAGYTLALSWSREYCKSQNGKSMQCDGSIGDFGFILHGLWPEGMGQIKGHNSGANYPQYCRKAAVLPRAVVAQNICMMPGVQLLQHEWTKHGTCMTRKPETYFKAARVMFGAIEFPDMDMLSRQYKSGKPLTAAGLANAFAANNKGLPANALSIKTGRSGWLQEVHICLAKNFKPRRCAGNTQGARGPAEIKIWRGS